LTGKSRRISSAGVDPIQEAAVTFPINVVQGEIQCRFEQGGLVLDPAAL
jgi:hypothetical protein